MKKLKRIALFMSLICLVIDPTIIHAVSNADFYSINNIQFYEENDAPCSSIDITVSGNGSLEIMWNYFKSKGLTNEQAAGLLGNIEQESGFSAFRHETGKDWEYGGYGIVQWTGNKSGGRRANMVAEMLKKVPGAHLYYKPEYGSYVSEKNGYKPQGISDEVNKAFLQFQLDYLFNESKGRPVRNHQKLKDFQGMSEWDAISKAPDIRTASTIWLYSFERPSHIERHEQERADFGEKILEKMKNVSGSSSETTSTSSCGTTSSPKSLNEAVLTYAWPDGKKTTERKPEYIKAIEKAKSEGRYVGDSCHGGGVDCGGFVTTLIVDSGWDTTYNYSGKISNGAGATPIQKKWLSENWKYLGGNDIDTSILQPGDVAIMDGHTFVYVGDIDGFKGKTAGASQCEYAPTASNESLVQPLRHLVWYRKK